MPGLFASWMQILCEPATAAGLRRQRLEMWDQAARAPCSCVSPNRLQDALDKLLDHHGMGVLSDEVASHWNNCEKQQLAAMGRIQLWENRIDATFDSHFR